MRELFECELLEFIWQLLGEEFFNGVSWRRSSFGWSDLQNKLEPIEVVKSLHQHWQTPIKGYVWPEVVPNSDWDYRMFRSYALESSLCLSICFFLIFPIVNVVKHMLLGFLVECKYKYGGYKEIWIRNCGCSPIRGTTFPLYVNIGSLYWRPWKHQ